MATITTPAAGVSPYPAAAAAPTVLRAAADGTTVVANAAAAATVTELAATNANTLVVVSGQAALNSLITTSQPGVFDGANVTINLEEQNFTTTNQVTSTINSPSGNTGEIQYNSGSNSFASSAFFTFTSGNVVTPGIRTDGYFYANGSPFSGGGSGNYSNSNVSSFLAAFGSNVVSTTGNITGGNFITTGTANVASLAVTGSATVQGSIGIFSTSTSLSATGNIIVGNILTGGIISAAGNITGNFFIGNGSQLTGIAANYGNANVVANLAALGSNPVSTTGNITGAIISASGSIQSSNITAGTLSAIGNIIANNASITNIVSGANLQLSGTANVGALSTVGSVSANGNITTLSAMYAGNGATWQTEASFPNILFLAADVGAQYVQAAIVETGGNASADWVSYSNNGNTDSGWIDMGITGNTFNDPEYELTDPNDGYILVQGTNRSAIPVGGNLILATGATGLAHDIIFATGGFAHANIKARLYDSTGEFSVVGNIAANNIVTNSIRSDDSTFVTIEDGVNITSGFISAPENLSLTANAQTWTFTNGVGIVLPGGAVIRDTSGGSLAIGVGAGALALGNTAVAIGYQSAFLAQGNNSVAIGRSAGETQGEQAVAIGLNAGRSQGNYAVAIGKFSANSSQGEYSVAIGPNAGFENQLSNAVSIGSQSGASSQGINSVAVGVSAAYNTQGNNSVAVGNSAGYLLQGLNSVAIGDNAGFAFQGNSAVAIGQLAGNNTQGEYSAAFGYGAGANAQGLQAVAIGSNAGADLQGNTAVAIGAGAGFDNQGNSAVAIGYFAGQSAQGNNSIIINATGAALNALTANTFTVAPVRNDVANIANIMFYNATSKEITYGNTISVTGNITGNYFLGNGSQLTSVAVPSQTILPTIQTITAVARSAGLFGAGQGGANVTVANTIPVTEYGVIITAGTVSETYKTGALGSLPGPVSLTFTTGLTSTQYTLFAYVTSNAGTYYSDAVTGTSGICLLAGTQIALSDGTHKAIEDITYTDKLLSWNFDRGCYAETTAMWIKRSETGSQFNLLTFSDGTTLRTFDQHRIFNKQAGAFTYPKTAATPVGTVTVNEHGQEITLTNKQVIKDNIEYYNVITDYHMNLFSDSVLTSCRFNNIYPIVDMKFAKDSRTLRTREEFENIEDRFFHGLRLAEQTADIETVEWYVNRLLSTEVSTQAELAV